MAHVCAEKCCREATWRKSLVELRRVGDRPVVTGDAHIPAPECRNGRSDDHIEAAVSRHRAAAVDEIRRVCALRCHSAVVGDVSGQAAESLVPRYGGSGRWHLLLVAGVAVVTPQHAASAGSAAATGIAIAAAPFGIAARRARFFIVVDIVGLPSGKVRRLPAHEATSAVFAADLKARSGTRLACCRPSVEAPPPWPACPALCGGARAHRPACPARRAAPA